MPTESSPNISNNLSPEELVRTKRQAEFVNQKNKAQGKNYGEALGKDSFLKLLVTELTHQDPTKPMQDREFIAQMAQFSSLEQMHNVSKEMKTLNASNRTSESYSLLGKTIQGLDSQSGAPVEGSVSHVIRKGGEVYLSVGKHQVKLDDVHAVFPGAKSQQELQNVAQPVTQDYQQRQRASEAEFEEDLPSIQSSSSFGPKGVMNSFNKFENLYDTNSRMRQKAAKAYNAE